MNIFSTKTISDDHSIKNSFSNTAHLDEIKQEEIVNLLSTLKQQNRSLPPSPHKIILDHAIQICQLFLNNMLEIDWHKHLYERAQSQNKGLNEQLTLVLKLLELSGENPYFDKMIAETDSISSLERLKNHMTEKCPFQDRKEVFVQTHSNTVTECMHSTKLDVNFFGTFRVSRDGKQIDCLSKSRAKQLLKYLILNRTKSIPKEVLMDRFWPDHDQSSARNNLNVAVYCLRQTLKSEHSDFVHVLFQDGCYLINPNLITQVDTEMFEHHVKAAERLMAQHKIADAIEEYKRAETLYQGDFLAEDLYEEWSLDLREHYKFLYVKLLGKLSEFYYQERALWKSVSRSIEKLPRLKIGDEHAHRRLMEYFARLNQRHLALRQYHTVEEALAKEFDLKPSQETFTLYKTIKAQELCEMDCGLCLKQA